MLKFRSHIGSMLIKRVFGLYFLITVLITAVQLISEFFHVKGNVKNEIASYQLSFQSGLAESLWSYDVNQIKSIVHGMRQIESISGVAIYDAQKKPIVVSGIIGSADAPKPKTTLASYEFPLYHKDDDSKNSVIGYGAIFSDNIVVIKRVQYGFLLIIVNSFLKTSALWIIILFFVRRIIANPLNALTDVTAGVDPERPETCEFDAGRKSRLMGHKNEIGALARSFFQMSEAILQKIKDIQKANSEIVALNASLERKVELRTKEISALIHNLRQGVFAIGEGNRIQPEYSRHLEEILETKDIAGMDATTLLFDKSSLSSDRMAQASHILNFLIGEDRMNYDVNVSNLPKEMIKDVHGKTKLLELDWAPIEDENGHIEKVMVSVKDKTDLLQAQRKADEKERELQRIGQVVAIPYRKFNVFMSFGLDTIQSLLDLLRSGREDEIRQHWDGILRQIHTIKGNARTYGFDEVSNDIHLIENFLHSFSPFTDSMREPSIQHLEQARQSLLKLQAIGSEKLGRAELAKFEDLFHRVGDLTQELSESGLITQLSGNHESLLQELRSLSLVSFQKAIAPVLNSLPRLSQILQKPCPSCLVMGQDFTINKNAEPILEGVFMHLVRNSMDHGLGPDTAGQISLELSLSGGFFQVIYSDNGRGLDLDRLKRKAIGMNLITKSATVQETAELIFQAGMSSRQNISEISGRGVGMSAVRELMEAIGGSISVQLTNNESQQMGFASCCFVIRIPQKIKNDVDLMQLQRVG